MKNRLYAVLEGVLARNTSRYEPYILKIVFTISTWSITYCSRMYSIVEERLLQSNNTNHGLVQNTTKLNMCMYKIRVQCFDVVCLEGKIFCSYFHSSHFKAA